MSKNLRSGLNRELWTILNRRFTDAAADGMWTKPDVVWGLFGVPERDLGILGNVGAFRARSG